MLNTSVKLACYLAVATMMVACSNRSSYYFLQQQAKDSCRQLPVSEKESCLAEAEQTYDDYTLDREAIESE